MREKYIKSVFGPRVSRKAISLLPNPLKLPNYLHKVNNTYFLISRAKRGGISPKLFTEDMFNTLTYTRTLEKHYFLNEHVFFVYKNVTELNNIIKKVCLYSESSMIGVVIWGVTITPPVIRIAAFVTNREDLLFFKTTKNYFIHMIKRD